MSTRIEGPLQPSQLISIERDHVEAAGRRAGMAQQIVLGGVDQALLFPERDAGRRAAVRHAGPRAHLDEDQRAVGRAHDEVDLTGAARGTGGDSIIPLQQRQARALQMRERRVLARQADLGPVGF